MNLLEIRNTMEEEEIKGAFFCSFIVFQEMYRITARKNTRDHSAQSVILFQCNFRKEDKEQMNEKIIKYVLKRSMAKLKNTALRLLRMGDLVSQFSENQLVILVLDCNYEDSILVANRILFQFQELLELKNMKITVEIEEVSGNEHTKLLNII